jgi:hypothetical protein
MSARLCQGEYGEEKKERGKAIDRRGSAGFLRKRARTTLSCPRMDSVKSRFGRADVDRYSASEILTTNSEIQVPKVNATIPTARLAFPLSSTVDRLPSSPCTRSSPPFFPPRLDRPQSKRVPKLSRVDRATEFGRTARQGADVVFAHEVADPEGSIGSRLGWRGGGGGSIGMCRGEVPPIDEVHVS